MAVANIGYIMKEELIEGIIKYYEVLAKVKFLKIVPIIRVVTTDLNF